MIDDKISSIAAVCVAVIVIIPAYGQNEDVGIFSGCGELEWNCRRDHA